MKNIWLLMKTNMKRNFIMIIFSILSAGVLCLILTLIGSFISDIKLSKLNIGLIDYDKSSLSDDFKRYLTDDLNYVIMEETDYDKLSSELIEKHISAIIEIPQGFMEAFSKGSKEDVLLTTLDDFENAAFLQAYLNSYMASIQILVMGAEGNQENFEQLLAKYQHHKIEITQSAAVEISKDEVAGKEGFIQAAGFFLMIIFSMSIFLAFMILDDRMRGVFGRIQITPVKSVQYMIGSGIFGMLTSVITIGIFGGFVYLGGIKIAVPIETVVLCMILFALITVCFSMVIALAVKSKNAIVSIIVGYSTIGCVLGGAYFPLDLAPESLQNLAKILPQYWFMDAFRRIQEDGSANIIPNLLIMTLFSVLIFLIGAVLYTQNNKNQ